MARLSPVVVAALVVALAAPIAAYALYPSGPNAWEVASSVAPGTHSRHAPLGGMVGSLGHAVCLVGRGVVHGRPGPPRLGGLVVVVDGRLVAPAPGPWLLVGGGVHPLTAREVAREIAGASEARVEGYWVVARLPGAGRTPILVATKVELLIDGRVELLVWAAHAHGVRHWGHSGWWHGPRR